MITPILPVGAAWAGAVASSLLSGLHGPASSEVPGAADTFRWCRKHGIKVATDTGFHRVITNALMDGLGWVRDGLVDIAVDVRTHPGEIGKTCALHDFLCRDPLNIQSIPRVIKIGDTLADMLEGRNAGVPGVVGARRPRR
jgi:phosphoglycolate phosphatase-like HAD superfamily hydrolase